MRRPLVICGPSGVGKGTLIDRLMKEFPDAFAFSVSHTTRAPREGEQDGVHYNFTDKESMERAIANNEFIEHANVHGNLYGTSIRAVLTASEGGKCCLLDIDVQGARSVHKLQADAAQKKDQPPLSPVFVFVRPPTPETLLERLKKRGTESEESMQRRLANSVGELKSVEGLSDGPHCALDAIGKLGDAAKGEPDTFWHLVLTNAELDEAYTTLRDFLLDALPLRE